MRENSKTKKTNKRHPIVFYLGLLWLFAAIFATSMTGGSYAKYTSAVSGGDGAEIAMFKIDSNLSAAETAIDLENIKPGFTQTVNLEVVNESEVSVAYEFDVWTSGNLPLVFEFSKNGAGSLLLSGEDTAIHTLTVSWPEDKNDVSYAYEVDAVIISLVCTQID